MISEGTMIYSLHNPCSIYFRMVVTSVKKQHEQTKQKQQTTHPNTLRPTVVFFDACDTDPWNRKRPALSILQLPTPEGPSTQYSRSPVPNTILVWFLEPGTSHIGPSGKCWSWSIGGSTPACKMPLRGFLLKPQRVQSKCHCGIMAEKPYLVWLGGLIP